jgi:two-component system OmpR family sensor kinase
VTPAGSAEPADSVDDPFVTSVATADHPHPRWWSRTPLRLRLVAAVLTLVAFALIVISAGSVFALRDYLVTRLDSLLATNATRIASANDMQPNLCQKLNSGNVVIPTDFVLVFADSTGCNHAFYDPYSYGTNAVPVMSGDPAQLQSMVGKPFTLSSPDGHQRWRLLVAKLPYDQYVTVGEDMAGVDNAVDRLVLIDAFVGVSVMAALAVVGVYLVRVSLRPLVEIERTASAIAGGDLTRRVPELDPRTELGQLSASLNTMLAQIEAAFLIRASSEHRAVWSEERMRQFVADASHELRTPLTTIRGFAELYRQGAAADPAEVLRRIEDEAARMGLLVEDLLLLARLDQERPLRLAEVGLSDLIEDAAAAAHAVAPDRSVEVDIKQPPKGLVVLGDEARLRQVIANLATNAITHTPPGTSIALRLRADGKQHAILEVSDEGPGLTAEQAEHVFERFYRVDKARTRQAATITSVANGLTAPHSGSGLGLAIVAALVSAHSGTVEVDTAPGRGATFRVRLPLSTS